MKEKLKEKYVAQYQAVNKKSKPAEVAELDEAKTDDNLKQDLHKLGRGQLLDYGTNRKVAGH